MKKKKDLDAKVQMLHPKSEIFDLFHLWFDTIHKLEMIEKGAHDFGSGDLLSRSEIHTIMAIGRQTGINITNLAEFQGISKSAISQMIRKLSEKNLVQKYRDPHNDKEVLLSLTNRGRIAYLGHEQFHAKFDEKMQEHLGSCTAEDFKKFLGFIEAIQETMICIRKNDQ